MQSATRSPHLQFSLKTIVVTAVLILCAYLMMLSYFGTQGFQDIKISASELLGADLSNEAAGSLQVLHSFRTEDLTFGEVAFPAFDFTLRIAKAERLSSSNPLPAEALETIRTYRLQNTIASDRLNPHLIRFASAHLDSRKSRGLDTQQIKLSNGVEYTVGTFFTKPEKGHALLIYSDADLQYLLLFSGKQQELEVNNIRAALQSLPFMLNQTLDQGKSS